MHVLIVDSEIYLAQSISAKLADYGYECDIAVSVKEAIRSDNYDVILLSTNIAGHFLPVVERYKNAIVILMVTYINHDLVTAPLKAGAKDYIMKPFMIEELIKKINHYTLHERLVLENASLHKLLAKSLGEIKLPDVPKKNSWPLVVVCSNQKQADAFVVALAKERNLALYYAATADTKITEINALIYVGSFFGLKSSEKDSFLSKLKCKPSQPIVLASQTQVEGFANIVIESSEKCFDHDEIFTIEEYAQVVLERFQDKYTDIELAKKLGISRKSIWERRKKYGISKKK